jgi:hypothetical protein
MILAWLKKRNFAFSRVMSPTRTWFIVVAMVLAAVKELQMRAQPTQPHSQEAPEPGLPRCDQMGVPKMVMAGK